MIAYILTDDDFARLLAEIDRDPQYGASGGSSQILDKAEQEAHHRAHRFFNYTIRRWIESVQKSN